MAKKHSLPVKAAIEELAGVHKVETIGAGLQKLLGYYEGAKETPGVRNKLVEDLGHFVQHIRDDLRRQKDAGLPDHVYRKNRPPMYGIHDLK